MSTEPAVSPPAAPPPPLPERSDTQDLKLLALLSLLMSFASISTDLYLPALPVMATSLHSDAGAVELTISGYLVGFSLGQLLWGPVSDRFGRRPPIVIGLVLFIAGSAGCALSGSVSVMMGWRMVQALGACASVVLSRAMVRDLYSGTRAAQMLSVLMTVMGIAPLVGPSAGGLILHFASWHAIFWVLVIIGSATLWAIRALPETLPPERRQPHTLLQALGSYGTLLGNRRLLLYAGINGSFYGGMFAYVAGTPVAYIQYHHVSPQYYGLLFALGIVGIMLSNHLNARLVHRYPLPRLIRWGTAGAAGAGLLTVLTATTGWGGLIGLMIPLLAFLATTGLIVANAIIGALECAPNRTGTASALAGAIQYGSGILGSACVGYFADGSPRPLAYTVAGFGLLALLFSLGLGTRRCGVSPPAR